MNSNIQPLEFNGDWNLSPSLESTDHIDLKDKYGLFINGAFLKPLSNKYFSTINPSNENQISLIAEAGSDDINLAVKSAKDAYENVWSKMPAKERSKYIYRIAILIQEKAKELAVV